MKKNNAIFSIMLILTGMLYGIHTAFADVTIQNGSALTINNATLDMNCADIIVAGGATLDLGSGVIDELGELIVDPEGTFIEGSGTINTCSDVSLVAVSGSDVFGEDRSDGSGGSCFITSLSNR